MPRVRFIITFSLLLLLLLPACAAPSPTPPPLVTSSPFPLFTPSPLPLFTPTPSLLLHAPDPATLVRVLNYGIGLERDAWETFDYPTFHGDFLTSPEARGLFDFVQADLERYYPNGLPNAETLFTDGTLDPNIWFPPRAVWLLAQTAVVNLLREGQSTLTENTPLLLFSSSPSPLFSLTPISHELDGDPTPEWLVEVTSEAYNLHGWIPLDEMADGYTLISNDIQHENLARGKSTTFQFTPDLNGDGLDDLVMHFDGQALGTQFGELRVYGKVGLQLELLDTIPLNPGYEFDIDDHFNIGVTKIRVVIPHSLNFECNWQQLNWYRWQGAEQKYSTNQETPPDTPVCLAAQALSTPYTTHESIDILTHALMGVLPENAPSPDYLALLRVHQAMLYAAKHDDPRAVATLDSLAQFTDSPFAELASAYWATSQGSPLIFCVQMQAAALRGEPEQTDLAPYLTPAALFTAYGNSVSSYASLICPLRQMVIWRMGSESVSTSQAPVETLQARGYSFVGTYALNIDADKEPEWILAQAFDQTIWWVVDPTAERWTLRPIQGFPYPVQSFQVRVERVNPGNIQALFLLGTYAPTVPVSAFDECSGKGVSEVSELWVLQWTDNIPSFFSPPRILCGEPPRLADLTPENLFTLFIPSSSGDPTQSIDLSDYYQFLEEQEALILAGNDLFNTRIALQSLSEGLSPDFFGGEKIIPRLLFDLGLSYELEGDTEAARAAYMDLIAQWPDSPWAWLAEARVGDPQS